MRIHLIKISEIIIGKSDGVKMESRFFNLIVVFISIAGILNAITEFYIGLPPKFYLFALIISILTASLYIYNRLFEKTKYLVWPLMLIGYLIVVYDWYLSGGLSGLALEMALAFIAVMPVLMEKKDTYIALLIMILLVIALSFIERYYPQLLNYYTDRDVQLQDIVTTFIVLSAVLVIGISILVGGYRTEQKKVNDGNVILQEINLKLKGKNKELKKALEEIDELSGLVPICSNCKNIRDDKGYWNQIEVYIEKHSNAKFSHSMCPKCSDDLYGDEDWYIEMKNKKGSE